MRIGVVFCRCDFGIRNSGWRIEHAEAKARGEQSAKGGVHDGFRKQSLVDGVDDRGAFGAHVIAVVAANKIHAGFKYGGDAFFGCSGEFVPAENVAHSATIGYDVAFEAPIFAQPLFQEKRIGARGLAVQGVVGAHDRLGFTFRDRRAEGGEIGVFDIMARRFDVGGVACGLRAAVNSEVFRGGDRFEILWIAALQNGDEGDAHARS